jgi:anti-sigma regulatory factor (Ser/Thr protein kinase)
VLFFDDVQTFDGDHRHELADLGRQLGTSLQTARRGEEPRPTSDTADEPVPPGVLVAAHDVTADPAAVAVARRFLRVTLHSWNVDDETADTAVLCLSELVTNAVIHSHAGCSVQVRLEENVLTTTVRDGGSADAATLAQLEDPLQVHGRGLKVVDALAARWGYELDTGGTTVWFVLDA